MTFDVIHGRAWHAFGPMPLRPPYIGAASRGGVNDTRIGDRPECRAAGDPPDSVDGSSETSAPPQEERRRSERRSRGPRLQRDPGSGEARRSHRRATDRPYWIPQYAMYAGLSPDEVLFGRR